MFPSRLLPSRCLSRRGLVIFFPFLFPLPWLVEPFLSSYRERERKPNTNDWLNHWEFIRSQVNCWARPLFDVQIRPDVDAQLRTVRSNAESPTGNGMIMRPLGNVVFL